MEKRKDDLMREFIETAIVGIIVISILLSSIVFTLLGLLQLDYLSSKHFDKSKVTVILDNKQVYKGLGYKVDNEVITSNLQSPYFEVTIHGKNYWDIENSFIGKDIKVVNN